MILFCTESLETGIVYVEISNSHDGWMKLGEAFKNICKTTVIKAEIKKSDVCSHRLTKLIINEVPSEEKIIVYVDFDRKELVFEGAQESLYLLGDNIYDYFNEDTYNGFHFHLNYSPPEIDEYCILAPTDCDLVFMYRE